MSGPVSPTDVPTETTTCAPEACEIEITNSRTTELGAATIRRALPQRTRRTVGAWCFVDHIGPTTVSENHGLNVGPHPHIGLQTVTWLLAGEMLHCDSLGAPPW